MSELTIIEYAWPTGVRIATNDPNRINTPMPGDPVDVPEGHPLRWTQYRGYGRIQVLGPHPWLNNDNHANICIDTCGVYLCKSGEVSISGGPFCTADKSLLIPTGEIVEVSFWNTGEHGLGEGKRIDFKIPRPLFRLAH